MEELKKKIQDEIAALEHELRTELPKQILHGACARRSERKRRVPRRQGAPRAGQRALRSTSGPPSRILHDRPRQDPRDRVGLGSRVWCWT